MRIKSGWSDLEMLLSPAMTFAKRRSRKCRGAASEVSRLRRHRLISAREQSHNLILTPGYSSRRFSRVLDESKVRSCQVMSIYQLSNKRLCSRGPEDAAEDAVIKGLDTLYGGSGRRRLNSSKSEASDPRGSTRKWFDFVVVDAYNLTPETFFWRAILSRPLPL